MKYLLDTNVIIDFFKKKPKIVALLQKIQGNELNLSAVTIAEFYQGAYQSNNCDKQIHFMRDFIRDVQITIASIDFDTAIIFGKLQAELMRKGKKKPVFDLMIAATCLVCNLILVTENIKDFSGIKGLKIYKKK